MIRTVTVRLSIEDYANGEEVETVRKVFIDLDMDDFYKKILDVIYEGWKQ